MNLRRSLSSSQERIISGFAGYELTASAWLPEQDKVVFVTAPVRRFQTSPRHTYKNSIVVGFLNLSTYALGSIVTEPFLIPRVSKIARWRTGILLCSAIGLAFLDLSTGKGRILLASERVGNYRVHDVTTHADDSIWFTCISRDHTKSKMFRFDLATISEISVLAEISMPTCICLSLNGKLCYVSCGRKQQIYVFRVGVRNQLQSCTRLTYLPISRITCLCVHDNVLYVSAPNELLCFNRNGDFIDRATVKTKITSFLPINGDILVMHDRNWGILEDAARLRTSPGLYAPRL